MDNEFKVNDFILVSITSNYSGTNTWVGVIEDILEDIYIVRYLSSETHFLVKLPKEFKHFCKLLPKENIQNTIKSVKILFNNE